MSKKGWALAIGALLVVLSALLYFATLPVTYSTDHPSVKILAAAVRSRVSLRTEPESMKWLISSAGWTDSDIKALDFLFLLSRKQVTDPSDTPSLRERECARILDEVTNAFDRGELDKARVLLKDDLVVR